MSSAHKNKLNPSQKEAVSHPGGPLLVLAGAGSGKTRIITERIAHLIDIERVRPFNILAVTFTNKAAGEMRERLERLIPGQARNLWIGTFHSICLRILKREADMLEGFGKDFVIYDPGDQIKVIKNCMAELNLSEKVFAPRSVRAFIDGAKNKGIDPADGAAGLYDRKVLEIYEAYEAAMRKSNALDFGDLLNLTVRLFSENREALEKYQTQFHHILVDEYQDTNRIQYMLVELLSRKHKNLFVVGDDNQSIYGWRGADIRNILDFENDFPQAKIIKLEENYRSTKTIRDAANRLISKNTRRHEKNLWTGNVRGERLYFYLARDEKDEASGIAARIRSLTGEGYQRNQIAVFYRTNNQSRVIEEEFLRQGVPYKVVGGTGFYERAEIKDILAYMKFIANRLDEISLRRIINVPPRGIGKSTIDNLTQISKSENMPLFDAAIHAVKKNLLPPGPLSRVRRFSNMITGLSQYAREHDIGELLDHMLQETGYLELLEKEEERRENVGEILNLAAEFEKTGDSNRLPDFLDWISLVSDVDTFDEKTDRVAFMTLHSAKGLEFPVVFIVGLEEDLLPHINSIKNGDVEEERRLFYVGLTRARKRVFLSSASTRRIFGSEQSQMPSRFLSDLPEEAVEYESFESANGGTQRTSGTHPAGRRRHRPARSAATVGKYRVGQKTSHPKFGQGIIKSVEGSGDDARVSVLFPGYGVKKIMAGYLSG